MPGEYCRRAHHPLALGLRLAEQEWAAAASHLDALLSNGQHRSRRSGLRTHPGSPHLEDLALQMGESPRPRLERPDSALQPRRFPSKNDQATPLLQLRVRDTSLAGMG